MNNYTTAEIISFVLGDAPPALADEIARNVEIDGPLSAKVQMLRDSVSSSEAAAFSTPGTERLVSPPVHPSPPARRFRRWQLAAAACLGLLLLTSLSWGAWELLKPKPLLQDSFSRPWFDSTRWHSERPILKPERGYLALVNRGSFRTQEELRAPLDLHFEWRWRDLAGYPHYSETLSVALRTSGKHEKEHPFLNLDGVIVAFQTYPGRVGIVTGRGRATEGVYSKEGKLPLVAEEWYSIRITDDGDEVAVYVRGPEVDQQHWTTPLLKASFPSKGGSSYVSIFNREVVAGVPHESHIRNLEVWPLPSRNGK